MTAILDPRDFFRTTQQVEEHFRVRRAARVVDLAGWLIRHRSSDVYAAQTVVGLAKDKVLELCPGCEDQFDLIYLPRLRRLIAERFGGH